MVMSIAASIAHAGTMSQPKVDRPEALSSEDAEVVIAYHGRLFEDCYDEGLNRSPALKGRVEIAFRVDAAGRAQRIKTDGSSLADDESLACMRRSLASLRFPKPTDGRYVTVRLSILFGPTVPRADSFGFDVAARYRALGLDSSSHPAVVGTSGSRSR